MNISRLITRIKMDLGIYSIALPIDVDKSIQEIIDVVTLETWSQLFPARDQVRISTNLLKKSQMNLEYTDVNLPIPDNEEVISVEDVYYDASDINGIGYYGAGMPIFSPNMLNDLLVSNVGANLTDAMFPKPTWDFFYPRKLRIYSLYGGTIVVSYLRKHDASLSSIPKSQEESFYSLAILDVKSVLYNVVKPYTEMETAHGRINLKIDDWENAPSARAELVKEWTDSYHLERKTIYYA